MFIKNARIADMTEEEIILEQSLEVPTVAARREEGKAEETCPVCYELFNQIYKQVSGIPLKWYFQDTDYPHPLFLRLFISAPLSLFSLNFLFFLLEITYFSAPGTL